MWHWVDTKPLLVGGGVTARGMDLTIIPMELWSMAEAVGFLTITVVPQPPCSNCGERHRPRRRGKQVGRQVPRAVFSTQPTHFFPRVT